jgi:hypothetical protein
MIGWWYLENIYWELEGLRELCQAVSQSFVEWRSLIRKKAVVSRRFHDHASFAVINHISSLCSPVCDGRRK